MSRLPKIAIIVTLCLAVVGCEKGCTSSMPFLQPATTSTADIKTDLTFGPPAQSTLDALPTIEKIAASALLSAAAGDMPATDIDSAFDKAVTMVVQRGVDPAEMNRGYGNLAEEYGRHVVSTAQSSRTWPPGYDEATWSKMAAIRLEMARQEIEATGLSGEVPIRAFRTMNQVYAWSSGSRQITPELDHFGRYDELVRRGLGIWNANRPPPRRP